MMWIRIDLEAEGRRCRQAIDDRFMMELEEENTGLLMELLKGAVVILGGLCLLGLLFL